MLDSESRRGEVRGSEEGQAARGQEWRGLFGVASLLALDCAGVGFEVLECAAGDLEGGRWFSKIVL